MIAEVSSSLVLTQPALYFFNTWGLGTTLKRILRWSWPSPASIVSPTLIGPTPAGVPIHGVNGRPRGQWQAHGIPVKIISPGSSRITRLIREIKSFTLCVYICSESGGG